MAASAVLINPITEHDYRLTVQTPFDTKNEGDITTGFMNYMHTETLLGAGESSTGQQDVTITPTSFSAALTSSVVSPGSISSTTAEMRFTLDEAAMVSFSGSAAGSNGLSGGYNIALFARAPRELLLFVDGPNGSSISWSSVSPITLQPGPYEFKAIAAIANGQTGTNFNNITATFAPVNAMPTGDYDGNGIVNANDYLEWRDTYGSTTLLAADGNDNGVVDAADYTVWRDNLEATSSLALSVPEPFSAVLLAFGSLSAVMATSRSSC